MSQTSQAPAPSMTAVGPDSDIMNKPAATSPGPIIGGVIGGVAVLCGLALVFFLLYRRRQRRRLELNVPLDQRSPRAQRANTWRRPGSAAVERARQNEGRLAVPGNPNARLSVQSLDLPPLAYEEAGDGRVLPRSPESVYLSAGKMEDGTAGFGSRDGITSAGSRGGVERSESGYGTLRSMTGSSEKGGSWKS